MHSGIPTGMVAFLFTDVEASTRRWERYGEAMRDAMRRHDEILRAEIAARRGYVFKTIGDAFCAAFFSASDALEAAVAVQRRLGETDFRAVDGLYVRMAIAAGETDERDGDYFGTAVNRVARLLNAGHGGQILLSGEAADRALRNLPEDIILRHLGTLPLRDITQPERVYQPVGCGLRSEFKPLRALETPPNNLPRQTTSFVGRHEDLARIEALLDEAVLVTIVGAGGIGKTRVALEVAAARLNETRDGAWFVDLASVGEASLLAGTMLSALGGESSAGADPLDDLMAYLHKRQLLLLLDNGEHLVSEVAAIVARIVAHCPHVSVLATSRSPLDISAETVYRISSLDSKAAVQLFVERARSANPVLRLEAKLPIVQAICERLDGIALAIELAASRVRTMPLESLASHLELRLLTGGRDRGPRQHTMQALIDWSYDLLGDNERRLLRRAAVFVRGFTLPLATTVCGVDDEEEWQILEILASLIDKSLVTAQAPDADQRYRILEPIREYAWQRLENAGEVREVRRRHATAVAGLAAALYDEWDKGPGLDWHARMELDLPNLRAALRWSLDEGNDCELGARMVADAVIVFMRLLLFAEGVEWSRRILEAGVPLAGPVEARLRYNLSMLYSNLGQNRKCLEEAEIAVPLYRQSGDLRGLTRALSQTAFRYARLSRGADATTAAREALELARRGGDRRLLADTLRRCAECLEPYGADRVEAAFAESVALFRSLERNDDTARALIWWGKWEEEKRANYARAVELLSEAAQLDSGDTSDIYYAHEIASCYMALGDRARAEPFARKAAAASVNARYPVGTALTIGYLAIIAGERDPNAAARLLGYAQARLGDEGWELLPADRSLFDELRAQLSRALRNGELETLLVEGAALNDDQALSYALAR